MSAEEAVAAAKQLPGPLYVVKSQIHAGGRGKGKFKELGPDAKGGVRLAKTLEEVESHAREMLGNTLVTIQTGEAGKQRSEEHTSELQSLMRISYAVFCLKKKRTQKTKRSREETHKASGNDKGRSGY